MAMKVLASPAITTERGRCFCCEAILGEQEKQKQSVMTIKDH